jgi:mitochondrial import inner membrane translocase subunit TIM10
MMMKILYRLSETCYLKCFEGSTTPFYDSELHKGQSLCVDRCVAKYFQVFTIVGERLTEHGKSNLKEQNLKPSS